MRTHEEETAARWIREMLHRERLGSVRPVVSVVRAAEPVTDLQSLWVRGWTECRVLGVGHGAGPGDVGRFWFLAGYSAPSGPDIVYTP